MIHRRSRGGDPAAPLPAAADSCDEQLCEGPEIRLRAGRSGDLEAVHGLLRAEALPTEGVDDTLMFGTSVAERQGTIVGCASVEVHGRTGLLRSVLVAPELRGGGWGGRLVQDRIAWARERGLQTLVLFTETAERFFTGQGFRPEPREQLPTVIRGSFEYGFCPSTSASMVLDLRPDRASRIDTRYTQAARDSLRGRPEGSPHAAEASCGYSSGESASVPEPAAAASLGCANPTSVASLAAGETVLDLGCGGGMDALLSARRVGPSGLVYGLDANDDMIRLAERNLAEAGAGNVRILKGRIEDVPLPDEHVDVVISNCVVNLSLDKPAALREAYRVLKPGGRLAVADIVALGAGSGAARLAAEEAVGCLAGTLSRTEAEELLRKTGFERLEVEEVRVYETEDLVSRIPDRALARAAGGLLMSAIVRARKPAVKGERR